MGPLSLDSTTILPDDFERTVAFSVDHGFLLAAFAHLMPFPGTALFRRLDAERRLLNESWWLDSSYSYNSVAFRPLHLSPTNCAATASPRDASFSPGRA